MWGLRLSIARTCEGKPSEYCTFQIDIDFKPQLFGLKKAEYRIIIDRHMRVIKPLDPNPTLVSDEPLTIDQLQQATDELIITTNDVESYVAQTSYQQMEQPNYSIALIMVTVVLGVVIIYYMTWLRKRG